MIMEIPAYDITIKSGGDFSFSFYLYDESGALEDLTGKTLRAQLRSFAEDSKAFDFVCQHNNQGGLVTLVMPHQITGQIRFRSGVYDVFQYNADGTQDCRLSGNVTIIPAVTR